MNLRASPIAVTNTMPQETWANRESQKSVPQQILQGVAEPEGCDPPALFKHTLPVSWT